MGLGTVALATPGWAQALGRLPATNSSQRPNIILIMADDMGFSDVGCYGGEIHTPNIDGLAAQGIRFTHFYNAARCCPTRAALLTGLYPHQAGMGGMVSRPGNPKPSGPYQGYLSDQCVTIAEVLHKAGYHTLMSGKWHVGESKPHWPLDRGFERYFGLINGAANYFDFTKAKAPGRKRVIAIDDQPYIPPKEGFYLTDAISEYAVNFLDDYGPQDQPFFLYVSYTAPHWPLHALPEDIEKYRGKYLQGWDVLRRERYERLIELGLLDNQWPLSERDPEVPPWRSIENQDEMALKMAVYAAQIDRMDQGIGRILATLRSLGKEQDTLVLFLSDNGGCHEDSPLGFDLRNNGLPPGGVDSFMSYGSSWANASNTPFRLFKHWVHEGGIATPLIARWPTVIKKRGHIDHQLGHVIDLMATCCDVAGARYPETYQNENVLPLEGQSLLPVFRGKQRQGHDDLCWEHEGNRAIRSGKWKLVSVENGKWELYDMEADRTELHDLAAQQPDRVAELTDRYLEWAKRCGV
ncbi:MAG: arylsulfatase [Fidelibacterota bacterium]|nr:MAG: arylsulfatase [Candidatus Neomarinimicrobiota bacterium]